MPKKNQRAKKSAKLKDLPVAAKKSRAVRGGYTKSAGGLSAGGLSYAQPSGLTTSLEKYSVTPIPIP